MSSSFKSEGNETQFEHPSNFINCYQVLGLPNFSSIEEISAAYKKLALKFHPDKNLSQNQKEAEEQFQKIKKAYDVLNNIDKHLIHDEHIKRLERNEFFQDIQALSKENDKEQESSKKKNHLQSLIEEMDKKYQYESKYNTEQHSYAQLKVKWKKGANYRLERLQQIFRMLGATKVKIKKSKKRNEKRNRKINQLNKYFAIVTFGNLQLAQNALQQKLGDPSDLLQLKWKKPVPPHLFQFHPTLSSSSFSSTSPQNITEFEKYLFQKINTTSK